MEKYTNDRGEVAVLFSPGYGSGWFTVNPEYPEIIFDPTLVRMVLDDRSFHHLTEYAEAKYPNVSRLGLINLAIHWVPKGKVFRIEEYDGSEYVILQEEDCWHVA